MPTPGGPAAWMSSNPWQRRVNWVVAGLLGAASTSGCGVLSWSLRSADRLQGSRIPASGDQFPLSDEPGKFRAGNVPRTVWAPCRHQLAGPVLKTTTKLPQASIPLDNHTRRAFLFTAGALVFLKYRRHTLHPTFYHLDRFLAASSNRTQHQPAWLLDAPVQARRSLVVGIAPNVALDVIFQIPSKLLVASNTQQPHRRPILVNPHAGLIDARHHPLSQLTAQLNIQ